MSYSKTSIAASIAVAIAVITGCTPERELSYQVDIKPILKKNCYECHVPGGKGAEKSGFVMDSYENFMKGTRFGQVIIPGSSISSSLYRLVAGKADPSIRMPHTRAPLSNEDIEAIRIWIDQGAKNN